jgi:hypothetical protein
MDEERSSVNLRDFESISLFFSEEEIEELLAVIEERRSRRMAHDGEDCPGSAEQPVYSPEVGEEVVFSEDRIRHPA